MRPRFSPVGLALFAGLLLAACTAGAGHGYRSSASYGQQCQDPDWFGLSACACGRCDRDGFDGSDRRHDRDRPDRDKPDRDPPPFAGKDS